MRHHVAFFACVLLTLFAGSPSRAEAPAQDREHVLEFRILANRKHDRAAIEQAERPDRLKSPPTGYRWVELSEGAGIEPVEGVAVRDRAEAGGKSRKVVLVKLDRHQINEKDFAQFSKTADNQGVPAVAFRLKPEGAARFQALTREHSPEEDDAFKYHLAIIVEGSVISAPVINDVISDSGIISMGGRSQPEEVDRLIAILTRATAQKAEPDPQPKANP